MFRTFCNIFNFCYICIRFVSPSIDSNAIHCSYCCINVEYIGGLLVENILNVDEYFLCYNEKVKVPSRPWNMQSTLYKSIVTLPSTLQESIPTPLKRIVMQSKDGVRVGAGWSYDDEKRPARFVYSLQWPLNEAGGGN